MSTNSSNDRASLCAFTFADGRQCRMPRRVNHPYLCAFHARKEAQALARKEAGEDIAYHLSGNYLSACDLSTALGRLFSAVVQGQIKPKTAATLAYLGQTIGQIIPLAQHEYIQAYSTNTWRHTVRTSHEQSADSTAPEIEPPAITLTPQTKPAPQSQPELTSNPAPALPSRPCLPEPTPTRPSEPSSARNDAPHTPPAKPPDV